MSTVKEPAPRFRVGAWVSFFYGTQPVWAQVIEDRGPLGVNRRRLYRIRLDWESDEPIAFEVPEDDLVAAVLDKAAVLKYLKEGGLVAILRSNLGGGRDQPRAWLTFDSRGNVTHTFVPERGLIGGAPVPFFALIESRVFTAKQPLVIDFLTTFHLTRAEAEDVIRSVGTAP
jgi:hypothetical protein